MKEKERERERWGEMRTKNKFERGSKRDDERVRDVGKEACDRTRVYI